MTGLSITSAGCHREQLATAAPRAGLALTHQTEAEEQDISGDWRDFRAGQRDTGGHSLGRVWRRCRALWWSKERKETFLK